MKNAILLLFVSMMTLPAAVPVAASGFQAPVRPVHTFSIVARDSVTGEIGVAVQSHWFSVGSVVTWARAGVGAVATQSFAEPAYGPRGLDLMQSGLTAADALDALVGADEGKGVRQVAFIDAAGNVAAYTGEACIESAGDHAGKSYSVQANLMANDDVVPAMAQAYENARGDLAERMMAALEAAQGAGGDIRGRQSAAILIVSGESSGKPWLDKVLELRVEDHARPLEELRRLLTVHRAYGEMDLGDAAVEKGKIDEANDHYTRAAELAPDNVEILFWQGITMATAGRLDDALPLLRKVFAAEPVWADLVPRLKKPGIIPDTPDGEKMIRTILKERGRADE